MPRHIFTIILLCNLTACAGLNLGLGLDNARVQASFDKVKEKLEQRAASGEITWVVAAKTTRKLDKYLAGRTDLDTTWKFDEDDEEYHAYCIALAERLDRKQITVAEYNAARLQRFNAIRARRQALYTQQQIANTLSQQQVTNTRTQQTPDFGVGETCLHQREWRSGFNKNCVYSCIGGEVVQTVGVLEFCPMTIYR